jgi:hypothetical protein
MERLLKTRREKSRRLRAFAHAPRLGPWHRANRIVPLSNPHRSGMPDDLVGDEQRNIGRANPRSLSTIIDA